MPTLNLNSDNLVVKLGVDDYRIVVKQLQFPVTITGATYYTFSGGGCTTITQTPHGNMVDVVITTPCVTGLTRSEFDSYTGATEIRLTNLESCCTGTTADILYLSGITDNIIADIIYLSGQTDNKLDTSIFSTYTGTTAPNQFAAKVHTHSQYSLTGHTHSQYSLTGHTHSQYSLTGHTHVIANVTGLQAALDSKSNTGHTHTGVYMPASGYTFTDSGIAVVTQSGMTVNVYVPADTITGVTWSSLAGNPTGSTSLMNLLADYVDYPTYNANNNILSNILDGINSDITGLTQTVSNHTGDTSIHFHMNDITGFTTIGDFNTYTGTTAPLAFAPIVHTHPQYLTGFTVTCDMVTGCTDGLYASIIHTHAYSAITDTPDLILYQPVSGMTLYSQTGHTHVIANVTGLQAALDSKSGTGHTHSTYATKSEVATFTGNTMTLYTDTKNYRGFIDGENITASYDWSTRRLTLTGANLDYYWDGVKHALTSPKVFTTGHTATVGHWYLYSTDGINFNWSQVAWDFDAIQVAHVYYQSTSGATFCIREMHGLMDFHAHEDLHRTIGTYLHSGGQPIAGSYTANTASNSANSPSFAQAVVDDEDLESIIPQWTKGTYTTMYVSGLTKSIYSTTSTLPFLAGASYIYVNNPSTGALAAGINNRYYNVYQILIPVTSDVSSQKYRMIMLQPQATYTSLAAAQAESVNGLYLGSLADESAEFVIYTRITYVTATGDANTGKCRIAGVSYNVGNHMGSISLVGGASTSNHANLGNLDWANSGHIASTVSTLAAFTSGGLAEELPKATFSLSGHTHSTYALQSSINTLTGTTLPATYVNKVTTIRSVTGATVLTTADNGKIIECNGTFTLTFYSGATAGHNIDVVNIGSGTITLAVQGTLQSDSSKTKLATQYTGASLYARNSNTWLAVGKLTS